MSYPIRLVTSEEADWTHSQPVAGNRDFNQLRAILTAAGWTDSEVFGGIDDEFIQFSLKRGHRVRRFDREETLRQLITAFRASGFEVGFSEACLVDFADKFILGGTLTAPLGEICARDDTSD